MAKAKRIANYDSTFAVRLREQMEKEKISQAELAQAIGKSRQAVNYYTLGETVPDADALVLISKCLNTSVDYLLGISDAPRPETETQDIHKLTGLSQKAIDTLVKINSPIYILDGYDKNWLKTINFLIETTLTEITDDCYRLGLIPALADYLVKVDEKNSDTLFVINPIGKIFKTPDEANKYIDDLCKESTNNDTYNSLTLSRLKASDFLELSFYNKLLRAITNAKEDIQKMTATDDN